MKIRLIIALALASLAQLPVQTAERDRFLYKDTPWTVLENLKRGNARFASHKPRHPNADAERRQLAANNDQSLYATATVLACSDSRVPVELIFDAGIMEFFVLRTPGNICGRNEAAGIEYGVKHAFTPLVLVLGHTDCGEVAAAMNGETRKKLSPGMLELIKPIRQTAGRVKAENQHLADEELVVVCTRENVFEAIKELFSRSPDVLEAAKSGKIAVAGAVYDVKTGKIDWLERGRVAKIMSAMESPRQESKP